MKTKISSSIIGLLFTFASVLTLTSRASAFSLVREDGSFNDSDKQVVGINDLSFEVAGEEKSFDVEFLVGSFNDVFGNTKDVSILEGNTPTFWNEENNARNAALAIINALGNEAFTSIEGDDVTSQLDAFFVPYEANLTNNFELKAFFDTPQTSEDSISNGSVLNLNSSLLFPFAKFKDSATPITIIVPNSSSIVVPESSSTITIFLLTGLGFLASPRNKNS